MIRSFALLICGSVCVAYGQSACDKLKSFNSSEVAITAIESVAAGPYAAAGRGGGRGPAPAAPAAAAPAAAGQGRGGGAPAAAGRGGGGAAAPAPPVLPAFCRVAATLKPSSDSVIQMELWLPADTWNGKFEMVGNGGWAGTISFPAMQAALKEGYATSSTDTGHVGGDAVFGLGHPEKLVDFAYRSVHETAVKSKAMITAFYGKAPKLSYWNGCSTGGRQGLMEAQRYPDDFDAIVAGAPANAQTRLHAWDMMVGVAVRKDADHGVPAAKLAMLNRAVMAACDAQDGVKDGLLNDPRKCKFDPATLLCKNGPADDCLTAAQVEAVKLVYSPAKKKNGEFVFPGKEPGGEAGWNQLNTNGAPQAISVGTFQYATYQDAKWDWRTWDLDRDLAAAEEKFGYVNATPDLTAFKARGGKLLLYHGWNDSAISPENTVNYYTSVVQKTGKADNWMRLFMIPGMGHCQGGNGTDQFNKMAVLERWRESNVAPDQIVAAHVSGNNVDMTRPLCPYPQVATFKGTGSTNDAASFSCKAP